MGKVPLTGEYSGVTSTVASFAANGGEMLGALAADSRCVVVVVEFENQRYVQFWIEPDGAIVAEVVSNVFLGNHRAALSEDQEGQLRALGWSEPIADRSPNWEFVTRGPRQLSALLVMVRATVLDVLAESPSASVLMRSWEMKDRSRGPCRVENRVRDARDHCEGCRTTNNL